MQVISIQNIQDRPLIGAIAPDDFMLVGDASDGNTVKRILASSLPFSSLEPKLAIADYSWNTLPNKPSAFTPDTHNQAISTVTGLQTSLDSKLETADYSWNTLPNKPSAFTPDTHNQPISTVTGLQTSLDSKLAIADYSWNTLPNKPSSLPVAKNYFKNGNFQVIQGTASGTIANSTAIPTTSLGYLGETEWCIAASGGAPAYAFSSANESVSFTGAASTSAIYLLQRLESREVISLANKLAGMTFSVEISNTLLTSVTWEVFRPTSAADTHGTISAPTQTLIASGTFVVNNTLTRYSASFNLPALAARGLEIRLRVGGQTSGTWVVSRLKLEEGDTATNFICNDLAIELIRCQRHFYALPATNARFPCPSTGGFGVTYTYPFKVTMFNTPAISPKYTGASNVASFGTPQVTSEGFSVTVTGSISSNTSWTISASCSAHIP